MKIEKDIVITASPTDNNSVLKGCTVAGLCFLNNYYISDDDRVVVGTEVNKVISLIKEHNLSFAFKTV